MEENNLDNNVPAYIAEGESVILSDNVTAEFSVEAVLAEEPVVEAPVYETKVEEVALENNIQATVSAPEPEVTAITSNDLASSSETQALGSVADGAIGVTWVPKTVEAPQNEKPAVEKLAVFSTKNISVPGLGKVYRGYNIVKQDAADEWVTKPYIRLATPEEVAKEFGK